MVTLMPELSYAASPLISVPICDQVSLFSSNIRTCPESAPFPSFKEAPMATLFPSLDIATFPDLSSKASPSISLPI